MGAGHHQADFRAAIAANVRRREIHRQLRHNQARKMIARGDRVLRDRTSPLVREYAATFAAAVTGTWVIGIGLRGALGVDPLYLYASLGLVYACQATYHKYRLALDPGYQVPRCKCAGKRRDDTEAVLRSDASALAGVPNSGLAVGAYIAMIVLRASEHTSPIVALAAGAVLMSAYLGYAMVFKIRGLCSTCITLGALNVMILVAVVV